MFQRLACALRAMFDDWLRYASYSSDLPLLSMAEVEWYLGGIRGDAPFPGGDSRLSHQKTGDT